MNIQSLNGTNPILNLNINDLREGQRLFIEVLRVDPSGQGLINIQGNLLKVQLETTVQPGDTFWTVVKKIGNQELILSKEGQISGSPMDILLMRDQGSLQIGRGITGFSELNEKLLKALNTAKNIKWNTLLGRSIITSLEQQLPQNQQDGQIQTMQVQQTPPGSLAGSNLSGQSFLNIAEKLLSIIPRWAELNGEKGIEQIRDFLSKLGVGYERKIAELLLAKDNPPEEEIAMLKDMIKAQLLLELEDQKDSSINTKIQGLLDKIIGQQLFLGDITNSYVWLSLPLRDNSRLDDAKIVFQSNRQKKGLDQTHCRIGVYIETLALGKIGVDGYLSEDLLNLRILSDNPQDISELVQEFKEETIARFASLGLRLTGIDVGSWEPNSEFMDFVSGEPRQGVDIYV